VVSNGQQALTSTLHRIHTEAEHIVVSAHDSDITVLLLAHFDKMECETLWLKSGTSKKQKYIPIHEIRRTLALEQSVLDTIPALHAITGCDTVSFLSRHLKKTSWDVFLEQHKLLEPFGKSEALSEESINSISLFNQLCSKQI